MNTSILVSQSRFALLLLLALVALLALRLPAHSAEPADLDPEALWSIGVLTWEYQVPEDLPEGEFDRFEWAVPAGEGRRGSLDADLSFEGIPPGAKVRLYLWIGDFFRTGAPRERSDGIPYSMLWRHGEKEQKRFGTMKVPKNHDELFSFMPAGRLLNKENGLFLMLASSENAEHPAASLEWGR